MIIVYDEYIPLLYLNSPLSTVISLRILTYKVSDKVTLKIKHFKILYIKYKDLYYKDILKISH